MEKVLQGMIARHADEASFLWERRDRACRSPLYDLGALAEIDRRLEANLEGVVVAGPVGVATCVAAVARGGAPEHFVAAYAAAESGDALALAKLLRDVQGRRPFERATVAALAWLSPGRAELILRELLAPECPASLHGVGLAALAARRTDPGDSLGAALRSPSDTLRAVAARAAGSLGRRDLLPTLRAAAADASPPVRTWSAWSAVLLGDDGAVGHLWRAAAEKAPYAMAACDLAARRTEVVEAARRLEGLARSPHTLDAALAGAAALGDPASLPWVMALLETDPARSRRATWVIASVLGTTLEPPYAVRVPTAPPTEAQLRAQREDPWSDLPTPCPEAIRARWGDVRSSLRDGVRRLGGRDLDTPWAAALLREGVQPLREAAAIELTLATGARLAPVHAPGPAQLAWRVS